MGKLRITAKLIRLVKACTYESKSKGSFGGELSDNFPVTTCPGQDDVLSPALFNFTLESGMRIVMTQAKGIQIKRRLRFNCSSLWGRYSLIAKTAYDLKNIINILLMEGKKFGLNINEINTKYMIVSRQNHKTDF